MEPTNLNNGACLVWCEDPFSMHFALREYVACHIIGSSYFFFLCCIASGPLHSLNCSIRTSCGTFFLVSLLNTVPLRSLKYNWYDWLVPSICLKSARDTHDPRPLHVERFTSWNETDSRFQRLIKEPVAYEQIMARVFVVIRATDMMWCGRGTNKAQRSEPRKAIYQCIWEWAL